MKFMKENITFDFDLNAFSSVNMIFSGETEFRYEYNMKFYSMLMNNTEKKSFYDKLS